VVELGTPVWTSGQFTKRSALDDLGLESVGAGLLRRLIPGVVQTTGNAGYYAFYPYLLAKWEDEHESVRRSDFKPFYRRQEAAYAAACVLHSHRGALGGIQGSIKSGEAVHAATNSVNVAALADSYMDSPYGGYGLFYARALEDMRLTQLGAQLYVDRVTDVGRVVAEAFAREFEDTRYYREYFDAAVVPLDALEELGVRTCSCSIPGRADHQPLLDAFFGELEDDPVWATRRRTRIESLSLFLEYHQQRPEDDSGDTRSFRTLLAERAFAGGAAFSTPFSEPDSSCRSTTISSSLNSCERRRRNTSCSTQRTTRYESDQNKNQLLENQRDGHTTLRPASTPQTRNRVNAPHTPLNSAGNAGHPFYPRVRDARAEFRRHAAQPPLTPMS
jgi:hypothetical protein